MGVKSGTTQEIFRIITPLVILLVGAGGFIFLKGMRQDPEKKQRKAELPLVDTETVVPHRDTLTIDVDGHVVPYIEVSLSAEVAGRIEKKEDVCRAGKFAEKDQVLLTIDSKDYDLEVERLDEEIEQAGVMLKEVEVEKENTLDLIALAEEDLKLAEEDRKRQLELREANATSQAAVDQAKRSFLQANNALVTLKNQLNLLKTRESRLKIAEKIAQNRREQADTDRRRTKITSPINGMVVAESVEEDSYVQKGTPLVTLEDTSVVEVRCHLRMDELYWIWSQIAERSVQDTLDTPQMDYQIPETPVTVVYQLAGQQYTWDGVLWRYDGIGLDEKTRTVPCRVRVDSPREVRIRTPQGPVEPSNGPRALVRGMFVNLEIHTRPKADLLQVRETAVQPGNKVWCLRDGRLQIVEVRVVHVGDNVAVLHAADKQLVVGDEVVVSPLSEVTDGMEVRRRESGPDESSDTGRLALATEDNEP